MKLVVGVNVEFDFITKLKGIRKKKQYGAEDIVTLLDADFKIGFTVIRLFSDQSKDGNFSESAGLST
jgi:hypothetical protein